MKSLTTSEKAHEEQVFDRARLPLVEAIL